MRRAVAVGLFALLAALAHGDERVLRVGTSGDYAPFSEDGDGFDVELAGQLARHLGTRLEWVRFRWPELTGDVEAGRFDVAMSGVTWTPERALKGYMTRAVASGGPCVIGDERPARVGVNRGGFLERWARSHFPNAKLVAVDDNRSLPRLLERRHVDPIVTDSFELSVFLRPGGKPFRCAPPADRKVYWVAPEGPWASDLGPRIDEFLRESEAAIDALRARYLGGGAARDELDHLVDLLARRLALMPGIAAWKRTRGRAIEDPGRERLVLERATREAERRGVDPARARQLFRVQIELAKAVQERAPVDARPLELERVRALLLQLGDRIMDALTRLDPLSEAPAPERLAPLRRWLTVEEVERLREAIASPY